MVEIRVIIEGGMVNTAVADAQTVNNSQALRQSLHRIFSKLLMKEVSIIVELGAGYRNAAKKFVQTPQSACLYVDLDDKRENQSAWFDRLATANPDQPIVIPVAKRSNVFFMIQEMEAWILKQPQAIDRWAAFNNYQRLHADEPIENHSLIAGKDIETIGKPSEKLHDLIKHYYKDEHRNKKIRYGKLKTAPGLLDHIDPVQLRSDDSELQRFCRLSAGTSI